jgi:hypothetical protein
VPFGDLILSGMPLRKLVYYDAEAGLIFAGFRGRADMARSSYNVALRICCDAQRSRQIALVCYDRVSRSKATTLLPGVAVPISNIRDSTSEWSAEAYHHKAADHKRRGRQKER